LRELLVDAALAGMLSHEGCISIYSSLAELNSDEEQFKALTKRGFEYQRLDRSEVRELEPAISEHIRYGVLFPSNRMIFDPFKLVCALAARFEEHGGKIETGRVVGFDYPSDGGATTVLISDGRRLPAKQVVIAAGVHSNELARQVGEFIPLESESGYHTQITKPGISLKHALIWHSRAFMVSPVNGGIRIGGSVEMAGLAAAPDFRRAKVLVRQAQKILPALQVEQSQEWMGHRPALPDTIPAISRSSKHRNLFYATGHGHLGLTYAATTGRLVAGLVMDRPATVDLKPLRLDRF
jgi:D-amino-acid dehydrogenase